MSAESEVSRRIQESGKITFAEFMEVALYWPQGGYYTSRENIGAQGDYYTSPAAHPAFGALLAVQLCQMWHCMDRPGRFTVVELGAGNGLLARDLVSYVANLPQAFGKNFLECLEYVCVDRRVVPGLESGHPRASRVLVSNVPLRGITGCVLSNEYLDAFPVHQVVMQRGCLREVYVTVQDGALAERLDEPSTPELAARLAGLGITLRDGQTAEVCLGLERWAKEIAAALDRGFVLSVDYGRLAPDLYSPEERLRGTLTTYYNHLQTDAPFERVGRQDITAQVDFTAVARLGKAAGLRTLGLTTQCEFLHNLGLANFHGQPDGPREDSGRQAQSRREIQANRAGMLDLVKPGGLGDFKVLAQGKNVGKPRLWGCGASAEAYALAAQLPVPTLTGDHLPLLTGRYPEYEPAYEIDIQALWPAGDEEPSDS